MYWLGVCHHTHGNKISFGHFGPWHGFKQENSPALLCSRFVWTDTDTDRYKVDFLDVDMEKRVCLIPTERGETHSTEEPQWILHLLQYKQKVIFSFSVYFMWLSCPL